jgi:hypothetical protein
VNGRTPPRVLLAVVVLGLALSLAVGFVTGGQSTNQRYDRSADRPQGSREEVVGPRQGVTVVAPRLGATR